MKVITILFILFLSIDCQSRLKEKIDENDGLLLLDRNNYDYAIAKYPKLIVLFTTYGCNLCLKVKSTFIELAKRLKEYEIYVAEVIACENRALSIRMNSQSYPAAYLYNEGEKSVFPNDEDLELLFEYALQNQYGLITQLNLQKEIDLFIKRSNIAVLSYYTTNEIADIAIKMPQIKFGIINQQINPKHHEAFITNKAFPKEIYFNGKLEEFQDFIEKNAYPLVFSLTEEEFKKAEAEEIPLIGMVLNPNQFNDYIKSYYEIVAAEFKGKLRFVLIDTKNELTLRRFQYFVGQSLEYKRIYYYNFYTKFTINLPYDEGSIPTFRKIVEQIQIYQEPFWEGDGYVHDLTPLNYQIQINQNPNHVILFNDMNACDLCFGFSDAFSDLSIKYQHRNNLVFAKQNRSVKPIREIIVEEVPSVYIYLKQDGLVNLVIYKGELSTEAISLYIEEHIPFTKFQSGSFPQTSGNEINNTNFDKLILNNDKPVLFLFYSPNSEHSKAANLLFEQLTPLFQDKLIFCRTDATKHQFEGFNMNSYPSIFFISAKGREIIKYDSQQRSIEKLVEFINEQLRIKNNYGTFINNGKVIGVTSESFQDIVIKSKQHVLVKFYAPWCGHCKSMAKEFEQLATLYRGSKDVLIAEMDWTQHQVPTVSIGGFPTLILFYKDGNSVEQIKYNKQRLANQMKQFIDELMNQHDEL
ncbi:unnamed protein product (macronuclear) [Paramecium tetraurelia]|uniref:Thioredoxin domain-containing protein n=1 Tax=Paramecium tetraurelia TaxID=5888 RepID=A0BUK5_PARTE|nr:uncharacterized protein GSPATT00005468001 [Paramecium tetraurelia]CAK62222.1 unnamed protein product [Paramecium tetraurelia]|eukprot:XP_001429620.1 hypothetical protein (macronuclear) [Paramecium tetraurelia strain d4-2]